MTVLAGGVYGTMTMRSFWSSGDVPVAFLAESVLGGIAFMMFFSYLAHGFSQEAMSPRLKRLFTGNLPAVFAAVIVVHGLFVGARTVTGLYGNAEGLQVATWVGISEDDVVLAQARLGLPPGRSARNRNASACGTSNCDDGKACTHDWCDETTGQCLHGGR